MLYCDTHFVVVVWNRKRSRCLCGVPAWVFILRPAKPASLSVSGITAQESSPPWLLFPPTLIPLSDCNIPNLFLEVLTPVNYVIFLKTLSQNVAWVGRSPSDELFWQSFFLRSWAGGGVREKSLYISQWFLILSPSVRDLTEILMLNIATGSY